MLEPPELVELLPEEEEQTSELSQDLRIVRRFVVEATVLVGLKVASVYIAHRLMKTVREMNKVNFPRQRTHQ